MDVLGINYSNDSAAALVRDGSVLAACKEERFSRIKHDARFPVSAVNYCLSEGNTTLSNIDAVAFFWNPGIHAESMFRGSANRRHHLEFLSNVPNHLLNGWLNQNAVDRTRQIFTLQNGNTLDIEYVTHHMSHAAGCFYRSNYEESAVLIVDGYGEKSSATIVHAQGTTFKKLMSVDFPHSVGSFYAAFTQYLGFRANNGEGKVMGMAGYGQPGPAVEQLRQMVHLTDSGFEIDLSYFSYFVERTRRYTPKLVDLLGPERQANEELTQRHYDIAYAVQTVTEEVLLHLASLTKQLTGSSRLCMSGGVVLNCVANTRIQREAGFSECYFQPCSGDGGTSMGAALLVSHERGVPRVDHPATDYLGPQYSDEAIAEVLKKGNVAARRLDNIEQIAAKAIAEGQIIGWFQGRSEFGPRALGNRSILANPGRKDMKDVLNARVKFREPFRPFAPSILADKTGDFFDDRGIESPYMLLVYDTLPQYADALPSITHVDGGARVQSVRPEQNPKYHTLINAVGELTGIPCVINTSFNIRGEPIVQSPEDALKCFFTTDMDHLFMGNYAISKPG